MIGWLDDAADVADAHEVLISWVALDEHENVLFDSDDRITGKMAAAMFRALAEAEVDG